LSTVGLSTAVPDLAGLVRDVRSIDARDTARYGGKAAGLARMHGLGLPVPAAFVIDTAACAVYQQHGRSLPNALLDAITTALQGLEDQTGKRLGASGGAPPLLVSVRSGAQVSMPGMMDTVLNLGLDRTSVLHLAGQAGDPAFAVDTWMRFWAMFADIVLDADPELLALRTAGERAAAEAHLDEDTSSALEDAVVAALREEADDVPVDPRQQLEAAIRAVFDSWDSRRARLYREHHGISHDLGTAVTVQAMVFGNLGSPSGSGVAFTRDPSTGERRLFGEYLAGGQGEEVVSGTRTPVPLDSAVGGWAGLVEQLRGYGDRLEAEYRDALDIEFTAEGGVLYLLQVRPAKRAAAAAVHIATALVGEGVISRGDALQRVDPEQVKHLVSPEFDLDALATARQQGRVLTTGVPASPGHGNGVAVLDADRAAERAASGEAVVLVRPTTSPQDLRGMLVAAAVVTARGGATSHAAVVSRALDKPCVVGCAELEVHPDERRFVVGGRVVAEGDMVSVDGRTGEVILGEVPRSVPVRDLDDLGTLLTWADAASGVSIWPEALSPTDVEVARRTGAPGIGVVSLTDLLQASGGLRVLLDAIARCSADPDAPASQIEDPLAQAVHSALLPLLHGSQGLEVDVRLPNLMSARARSWIREWTSLAPHLLAPLGPERLLRAYARGTGAAAAEAGHGQLTLLLGGITTSLELDAFAHLLGPDLTAGAVLQNPAVLWDAAGLADRDGALWIDLAELERTSLGQPEELLYADRRAPGPATGAGDPAPPGFVEDLLRRAVEKAGTSQLGVRLTSNAAASATAMYDLGFRRFTSSVQQAAELRLVFGRHAPAGGRRG
jgi:pyruvate,orthophosphate dikinase